MAEKLPHTHTHTHPRDCSLASPPCQRALIPQTLSAGELRCQKWWSNAFACVMPCHHSFIFSQTDKAQDEKPQHHSYTHTRPSEKSVIDHMLGILHHIQHAEPVDAKMSHSPQSGSHSHLSWYFSGQLIHHKQERLEMYPI